MTRSITPDEEPQDGFDVVVKATIGRVVFGKFHDDVNTAHEAAFKMIGRHGMPGEYQFPLPGGGTCRVTVEHDGEHDGEDL